MALFRADLHCHTSCSDGSFTPAQLVEEALLIGLSGLSITDHDSISSYQEAYPLAQSRGLSLLTGSEFSCVHKGISIHVLAYAFPDTSSSIREFCERHRKRRQERAYGILQRLQQQGIDLSTDEQLSTLLRQESIVGRPHIASAMVRLGAVSSMEAAFKRYLGEGCSCYVLAASESVEETLEIIHRAGGLAVLAHPHLIRDERILQDLLQMPFDGIEAHYARFSQASSLRWIDIAEKKGWFVTGGSDFHGSVRPQISLGDSWTIEATFHMLLQHERQGA